MPDWKKKKSASRTHFALRYGQVKAKWTAGGRTKRWGPREGVMCGLQARSKREITKRLCVFFWQGQEKKVGKPGSRQIWFYKISCSDSSQASILMS